MILQRISALAFRGAGPGCVSLLILAAAASSLPAQTGPTISIRILDGRTGEPVKPSNLLIRVDHKDDLQNTGLTLNGDQPATAVLPADAKLLSVQGTYNASIDIFLSCDSNEGRTQGPLQWYSIADIIKTGVIAPDQCYKGRYAKNLHVTAKPGEFVFFVRTHGWRDVMSY
ncbi:MAG TPA: hypothetical protein VME23_16690 [Terracidiphilus sp.]|nr:hypothetical protein [Terracidiphilus sp.]